MDNTIEDSKSSDGDGGAAAAGSGGDRRADGDRPRRRRSGDALRLQEALLLRRDGLLGGGSSASLDALDASPSRRRVRSRQASEDLLTMAGDAGDLGRAGGERDQQDADGQQAGDSTSSVGLVEGQQRRGGEAEQSGRSGELPPPRLASILRGGDDGSDRQEPLDRDRMVEILNAALTISAGDFGCDGQMEERPERIQRNHFDYGDHAKRPPQ